MQEKKQLFAIENLYRGSIINHSSFLMNDDMDTDAYCKTNVHCFSMSIETLNHLRDKYVELDTALDKVERRLVEDKRREPANDYIIKDPYSHRHFKKDLITGHLTDNFIEEQRRRKLTVVLKNAIMVVWQDVKKSRNTIDIEEVIKGLQEKARLKQDPNYIENLKQQRKEKRERLRKEKIDRFQSHMSQYISRPQFQFF